MRGASITFILIIVITVALISLLVGWTVTNTIGFFEINEINSVKQEFEYCNDKIMETARTGISNKCIFSVDKGRISGTNDEISYQIITHEDVCDQTPWVLIEPEKNLWQKCNVSSNEDIFGLKWNSTTVKFQFENMGNVEIRGQSGHIVEMSRASMSDIQTYLLLKIS